MERGNSHVTWCYVESEVASSRPDAASDFFGCLRPSTRTTRWRRATRKVSGTVSSMRYWRPGRAGPGAVGVADAAVAGPAAQLLPSFLADRAAVAVVVLGLHHLSRPTADPVSPPRLLLHVPVRVRHRRPPGAGIRPRVAGRRSPQAGGNAGRDRRRDSLRGRPAAWPDLRPGRDWILTCLSCPPSGHRRRGCCRGAGPFSGRARRPGLPGGAPGVSAVGRGSVRPGGTGGRPGLARAAGRAGAAGCRGGAGPGAALAGAVRAGRRGRQR